MDARKEILKAIRQHEIPSVEAPTLDQAWIHYQDRLSQFLESLASVGGKGHTVTDKSTINKQLAELQDFAKANKVCSLIDDVPSRGVKLDTISDPHDLADIDWAIIKGQFAVAENGAIWVTELPSIHRSLPFITQHLIIVLPISQIVDNMHQAYERINFSAPGFGVFISGPSKTADIEQSLVIGAHGARSLDVMLTR